MLFENITTTITPTENSDFFLRFSFYCMFVPLFVSHVCGCPWGSKDFKSLGTEITALW